MKAIMKAAISNITMATINLKVYFPSNPLGLSTKNNIAMAWETKTDKNILIADITCGIACTKINQTSPIPKAINKLSLMVS
jgi:hypothetical protein